MMKKSFKLKSMLQVLCISIIIYNLYTTGIFYLGIFRLIRLFGNMKKSFFYTLNVSVDAWNFEESLFQCLKRNISIKVICFSGNSHHIVKETLADSVCLNHNFNEFFYMLINIIFCVFVITGHILNSKVYPPVILFLYVEYRFNVLRSISISFDINKKTAIRSPPVMSPKKLPLSRKISFKPVDTIEQSENDDVLSFESMSQENVSKKLTYPTKTNVKDLERYTPKLDNGVKRGIFFDMTSKEGLSLWERYLKKLGSKRDDMGSALEDYEVKESKLDIDNELRKMMENGELEKYLHMKYRRVFITELKVWVTKNRLQRVFE